MGGDQQDAPPPLAGSLGVAVLGCEGYIRTRCAHAANQKPADGAGLDDPVHLRPHPRWP
jgi:hypothetical protein